MKIYFAASLGQEKAYEETLDSLIENRLESYATVSLNLLNFYKQKLQEKGSHMILDSGAFSVWTKGKELDIKEYINFFLNNSDIIDLCVNLDVIPGKPYKKPSFSESAEAAKQSWRNFFIMSRSIPKEKIIPVFHQGEDFKWLKRIVEQAYYIGLSPANDKTTEQRVKWLDSCMKHVLDENGTPIVKFHGFAVTSARIMSRYPWHSVDSISWKMIAGLGGVCIPAFSNGVPDYTKTQDIISFTERSSKRNGKSNKNHYDFLTKSRKQKVIEWINSCGYEPQELQELYPARLVCNLLFYKRLQESLPEWPWDFKVKKNSLNLIK